METWYRVDIGSGEITEEYFDSSGNTSLFKGGNYQLIQVANLWKYCRTKDEAVNFLEEAIRRSIETYKRVIQNMTNDIAELERKLLTLEENGKADH